MSPDCHYFSSYRERENKHDGINWYYVNEDIFSSLLTIHQTVVNGLLRTRLSHRHPLPSPILPLSLINKLD
jgi:hypothetical protein